MGMERLVIPFSAGLGLILGSFLNVVIARLPAGQSLARPGSRCPGCGAPIRWHDNIPVLSYLLLRGRCRACRAPISPRYPLVELCTALLFVATALTHGWSWLLFVRHWPFVCILVAVTFIDLSHRLIPDPLSLGGLALGLATAWWDPELGLLRSALGAGLGFCAFFSMAWVYLKLSGRSGLGGGDIKLLAMIGAFVGPGGVIWTVLISSVAGSLVGISWALASRQRTVMGAAIPYGPFLVIGALCYYFFSESLWPQFMTLT